MQRTQAVHASSQLVAHSCARHQPSSVTIYMKHLLSHDAFPEHGPSPCCGRAAETRIQQHLRHCGAIAHRRTHTLTQQDSVQGIRNESVAYCLVRSQ